MDDGLAVEQQVGRRPRGDWEVARRCRCGLPQVIRTHPLLDDGTPFPTLYWLTCKRLNKDIGRLEATGWMADINQRLSEDGDLRRKLVASIDLYVASRDALHRLEGSRHPGGGPDRVKCLHAHTAHHLISDDNPVGAAALEELGWDDPQEVCI